MPFSIPAGEVTVNNVASYRLAANVEVDVPSYGKVQGDVAWGGNWFFLVREHGMEAGSRQHREADGLYLGDPPGVRPAEDYWSRQSGDRPHRTLRPVRSSLRRQQEFRSLSRQGLRSFPLRHRHQRQAGVPSCRRKTSRRPGLETREHCRQCLRGQHDGAGRQDLSQHQRRLPS